MVSGTLSPSGTSRNQSFFGSTSPSGTARMPLTLRDDQRDAINQKRLSLGKPPLRARSLSVTGFETLRLPTTPSQQGSIPRGNSEGSVRSEARTSSEEAEESQEVILQKAIERAQAMPCFLNLEGYSNVHVNLPASPMAMPKYMYHSSDNMYNMEANPTFSKSAKNLKKIQITNDTVSTKWKR
eukprot:gnl/TRDRNA2_/TRDRNA2_58894_c0_seq1.p1 gnl/TRDRNA2_/TRDRNA2_58894_c0~~gnl/TRDRNA2_/TRDRNA2_58894_c0_seq1.p1  ORF type:complete len:183 (-),score=30.73 gnl/TRDRNA2_/TRDRNA2_58894_c0_seq1:304-852(-)